MIELLCLSGFLLEETGKSGKKKWFLAPNCNSRTMLLFVDGLFLDRFSHLLKKLTNLPISFGPAFEQGLIFQQSLRIVEINGPLHMTFHMLQCILYIYNFLLKWSKDTLQWKRIKMNHVSDTFESANIFQLIVLGKAARLTIGHLLSSNKDLLLSIFQQLQNRPKEFIVKIAFKYIQFVKDTITKSTDERQKMLYSYILLSRHC